MQEANERRILKAHDEAISARLKTLSDDAYLKLLQLYQMQARRIRLMLRDDDMLVQLLFNKQFIRLVSDRQIIIGADTFAHDYLVSEEISEYLSRHSEARP